MQEKLLLGIINSVEKWLDLFVDTAQDEDMLRQSWLNRWKAQRWQHDERKAKANALVSVLIDRFKDYKAPRGEVDQIFEPFKRKPSKSKDVQG